MKRLLAYLFIVLSLVLTFSVNANADNNKYCVDSMFTSVDKIRHKANNLSYILKKYPSAHYFYIISGSLYKKCVDVWNPDSSVKYLEVASLNEYKKLLNEYDENRNLLLKGLKPKKISKKEPSQTQKQAKISYCLKNSNQINEPVFLSSKGCFTHRAISKEEYVEKVLNYRMSKMNYKGANTIENSNTWWENETDHYQKNIAMNLIKEFNENKIDTKYLLKILKNNYGFDENEVKQKTQIAKAEPSQTQEVDKLHVHLIKPDTWVYLIRYHTAPDSIIWHSEKYQGSHFLDNEKYMKNYKFDENDNIFIYEKKIGGITRKYIRISKKLNDLFFKSPGSVQQSEIANQIPNILKDLIDEYTENEQLKNNLIAHFDQQKLNIKPKNKVKVAKVEESIQKEFKPPICASGEFNTKYIFNDFKNCEVQFQRDIIFRDHSNYSYYEKFIKNPIPDFVKSDKDINYPICNVKNFTKLIVSQKIFNRCKDLSKLEIEDDGDNTHLAMPWEIVYSADDDYNEIKKSIITSKKKIEVAKKEPKEEEFKPENKDIDNDVPVIEIAESIIVDSQTYTLKGKVKDKSKLYLEANGRPLKITKKGNFELEGFVVDPDEGDQIKIVAIDQWKNKSEKTINIKVEFKEIADLRTYEKPNPNKIKVKKDKNKIAIIIGIEKYKTLKNIDAPYANRDANAFRAYANRALGIPNKNIKVLIDENATRGETLKALTLWLPQAARGKGKDIYIFFAGHGLASDDGKNLYILPQDGDAALLQYTAISRLEIFELISKVQPKSVTMFFDTCYSGQTRDEEMLVAGLRPIRLATEEQDAPNNFTIFTASNYDQTSGSINEAEHGIFSYYLMKGMEGNADSNEDKKITNGELITYLKQNVTEEAFINNRQQEPMLSGDPDKVLISYR